MRELGEVLWKIGVYEDRGPDGQGEKHQSPPSILFLPERCVKTMGTPEGSDRVADEVDVDGRTYDGDEDYGVEPVELPPEEGNRTGD